MCWSATAHLLPRWSPDGTKIAFASTADNARAGEVYVLNADGSDMKKIADDGDPSRSLSWSPDGRKLAYTSQRDGNSEIYVIDLDGSNPVNLTRNRAPDFDPDWGPR